MKNESAFGVAASRVFAVIVGIGLWYVSYTFSVAGFALAAPKQEYLWIGKFLALAITGYEIIWNSMKRPENQTMYWVGLFCYTYGIGTNILGISDWLGITIAYIMSATSVVNYIILAFYALLTIGLAVMFEIAPEPTIVYGITGKYNGGDFIGNLTGHSDHAIHHQAPAPQRNNNQKQDLPKRQEDFRPSQPQGNQKPPSGPNTPSQFRTPMPLNAKSPQNMPQRGGPIRPEPNYNEPPEYEEPRF